jgi:hypothetical protein
MSGIMRRAIIIPLLLLAASVEAFGEVPNHHPFSTLHRANTHHPDHNHRSPPDGDPKKKKNPRNTAELKRGFELAKQEHELEMQEKKLRLWRQKLEREKAEFEGSRRRPTPDRREPPQACNGTCAACATMKRPSLGLLTYVANDHPGHCEAFLQHYSSQGIAPADITVLYVDLGFGLLEIFRSAGVTRVVAVKEIKHNEGVKNNLISTWLNHLLNEYVMLRLLNY